MHAMGKMAAMGQIHAHERIARLQHGEENRHVGLCTGVWLHIGMLGTEQLLRAFNGQGFHHIHMLAPAIVTAAGIAFGILVGQGRACRLHDSLTHKIL